MKIFNISKDNLQFIGNYNSLGSWEQLYKDNNNCIYQSHFGIGILKTEMDLETAFKIAKRNN